MPLDGLLVIDKPAGATSHDVVERLRCSARMRRIGHTGTLDPFATGVLVLCLGRATRLADYLVRGGKSYRARARLGQATDTQDLTGRMVRQCDPSAVRREDLLECLARFTGELEQVPPMYSAKRKGGVRLHALARGGVELVREPVRVRIDRIELVAFDPPDFTFEVDCGRGTYIRTLAADIGDALGAGAHLRELRRTRNGPFTLEQAAPPERFDSPEAVRAALVPMDRGLPDAPLVRLDSADARAFCCGQQVAFELPPAPGGAILRVYYADEFLGLGQVEEDARVQPVLVLVNPSHCA